MSPAGRSVLLVAGLEPLGRAGLLVDVEAVRGAGADPIAIASCATVQRGRTARIEPLSAALIGRQLDEALAERDIGAVKLGLVPTRPLLRAILRRLPDRLPWVIDPVVRSSTDAALSSLTARDYLGLARSNVVLTPNTAELVWLSGAALPDAEARLDAARALCRAGFGAVIVKGGHLDGPAVDWVVTATRATRAGGKRLPRTGAHRGTGCRYASSLAAALANGASLEAAAVVAHRAVRRYLGGSRRRSV